MPTPITKLPKPKVEQYRDARKLFLVPTFLISNEAPEEGQKLLGRYWSEVRDHIDNLERSLGKASHVYHEMLFSEGEEGFKFLERLNPLGCSFIQAMCHSDAHLEATENKALVEECSDWQRCLGLGLMSEKVLSTALESYQQATTRRYEHIAARIDETLKPEEVGTLFMREDHGVQFPSDVKVFYVAPPALDALKGWINEQVRSVAENLRQAQQAEPIEKSEDEE